MATNRSLIVNADDLGLSPEINRGIFYAHEHGIVTSASLMIHRGAAAEAVEQSRAYPRLGLGREPRVRRGGVLLPRGDPRPLALTPQWSSVRTFRR